MGVDSLARNGRCMALLWRRHTEEDDMTQQPEERPEAAAQSPADAPAQERGDRPLLAEMPTFELAGHEYTMRRLGYADHSKLGAIVRVALREGKISLAAVATREDAEEQIETVIALLLGAFVDAPNETFDFLATVLEISRQTLLDPEFFPFGSLPLVLRKLSEHPDLTDFFAGIGAVMEGGAIPMPASSGLSTS